MLKKISFENYKAFENATIEIKPITILLGANSVGKSSILQLLLMLQQTSQADKNYKSALKLNGGYISLGESLNLIRKKDLNQNLVISFTFHNDTLDHEFSSNYLKRLCVQVMIQAAFISKLRNKPIPFIDRILEQAGIKRPKDYPLEFILLDGNRDLGKISRNIFVKIIDFISTNTPRNKEEPSHSRRYSYNYDKIFAGAMSNIVLNKDEAIITYDFLTKLASIESNGLFELKYTLRVSADNIIKTDALTLKYGDHIITSLTFGRKNKLESTKLPLLTESPLLSSIEWDKVSLGLDTTKTIFNLVRDVDAEVHATHSSIFSSLLLRMLASCIDNVDSYFQEDKINYVSPLRAHPKRYYFLDKAKINKYLDTLDGDALTEILRENTHLKTQVNNWLEKFNLQVDVNLLQDIIHKLVVKQNALNLDITDVGFGISQVLPVIIQGFLSRLESITIIEQPEIHLHPKMQADLADLFIDIVMSFVSKHDRFKYLLIETHSEYLLKRLRRRISEGVIDHENVGIYLVEPQTVECGAILKTLTIEEKGSFEWPKDFYSDELVKDTFEFLKNQ